MALPESYWPKKKLGELTPTNTVTEYEWYYFSIPRRVSTVALPVGMEEFSPKEIQRVFAPAADYARTLAKYGVDLIVQGGVPLPCVMGPDFLDDLLGRMHEASGIPTTANVLSMVAGAKRLGLKNIALAARGTSPFFT
jgi:maleate cis-trans isomerase